MGVRALYCKLTRLTTVRLLLSTTLSPQFSKGRLLPVFGCFFLCDEGGKFCFCSFSQNLPCPCFFFVFFFYISHVLCKDIVGKGKIVKRSSLYYLCLPTGFSSMAHKYICGQQLTQFPKRRFLFSECTCLHGKMCILNCMTLGNKPENNLSSFLCSFLLLALL